MNRLASRILPSLRAGAAACAVLLAGCASEGPEAPIATGDLCSELDARANAAYRQNFLTEYDRAERAWTDILATYDSRAEEVAACPNAPPRSIVLANLGLVYSNQRKFTAARGMFDAGSTEGNGEVDARTEIYRALHDLNRSAVGAETLARAETASISAGMSKGMRLLERDLSSSVLQLSPEAQRRLLEESVNLAALSFAHLTRGDLSKAERAIDQALARVEPIESAATSYVPRFQVTKAEVLLAQGRPEPAFRTVRTAISGYGADMRRSALMGRAEAVHGQILASLGRTEDALDAFRRGFEIMKGVPVRVSYDLLWPYAEIVRSVIATDPSRREELTSELFRAAQVVRDQVTASSVSLAAASLAEGTGELAQAIREYNAASEELALVVAQKLMVEGQGALSSPVLIEEVQRRFNAARTREERAAERVLELDPDYFERISGSAPVDAVQDALAPDEAFVQIVLGEPESLVFLVRGDDFRMMTVSDLSAAETTEIVAGLREILRTRYIYTPNESYRIYSAFLEPLEGELAGISNLIFSLSGALTTLPMEILATKRSAIDDSQRLEDFTDVAWLGDAYEVSYVPAPRNLTDLRQAARHGTGDRPIIAFGDFQPGADVDAILDQSFLPDTCAPVAQAISTLPPLAGTREELEAVVEIFGTDDSVLVAGDEFTEPALRESSRAGRLAEFSVLHFATHGILPTGDCITRPALAVSAEGVPDSDGLLTDVEIRRLSLNADLVVLSACDTAAAVGEEFNAAGGEALSGLARAFFDAGTRAILATHWPVSDDVTASVVRDFYAGLAEGLSMTRALKEAQGELRRTAATSDPLFWGPFVMIGDARRSLALE